MLTEKNKKIFRLLVIAAAVAGLGMMAYLTYVHYAGERSFCDISEAISCDTVTTSIYSELFGLPVSLMGLGYFGLVLFFAIVKRNEKVIFYSTLFVLGPSLYLSLMEYFSIKALCILCELSKIMMVLILGSSFFLVKSDSYLKKDILAFVIGAAVIAAGILYFAQTISVY